VEEETLAGVPAVRHQVDLEKAGTALVPFGEGADRDCRLQQAAGLRRPEGTPPLWLLERPQQPVDGGGAHLRQLLPDRIRQRQLLVVFEGVQQLGHERLQPLAAQPAADLPQAPQGGGRLGAVRPGTPAAAALSAAGRPQGANQRLPVASGHPDRLIEHPPLLAPAGLGIARADRAEVFD